MIIINKSGYLKYQDLKFRCALGKHGINKKRLAENGVMIFLNQVFRDNFFHADMHPGNIFVSKKHPETPGYIAIDCAITGSLSNDERYILARMLQAVLKQNYKSLSQLFINSGWVNPNSNIIDLENCRETPSCGCRLSIRLKIC